MLDSFGNVVRGAVLQYITPFIEKLQDWIADNRELIATKIQTFVKDTVSAVKTLLPIVMGVYNTVSKLAPFIFLVAVGWKTWTIVDVVTKALAAYKAVTAASTAATIAGTAANTGATGAMGVFNAVIAANPIGAIITAVVVGITAAVMAMKLLSDKVGGLGNAFKVVGQTIMKYLLTPINLFFEYIKGILSILSYIPGVGDKIAGARDAVATAQNKMNTFLTGSESTLFNSGPGFLTDPYRNARAAELARQEAAAEALKADSGDDETNDILRQLLDEEKKNTSAVESLNDGSAQGIPGRLNYAQMGQEDFFSIARAGL
jgi:hypothetical protein